MKFVSAVAILLAGLGVGLAQQGATPSKTQSSTSAPAPKRVRADTRSFDLDPSAQGQRAPTIGAGSRGGGASTTDLYAPGLGLSYSARPIFYWQTVKGGSATSFHLYDANDDEVFEIDVSGKNSFAYPEDAPELKPGTTYRWAVEARGIGMAEPPPPTRFKVLSGAERQKVQESLADLRGNGKPDRVQRAQLFADNLLWYDAVAAYSQLIADYPNDAALYQARAEIYDSLPQTRELAAADLARAKNPSGK